MALLYAVMDNIGLPHLRAAIAMWEYCFASARYIFGGAEADPEINKLLAALRERGYEPDRHQRLVLWPQEQVNHQRAARPVASRWAGDPPRGGSEDDSFLAEIAESAE
jgi:hypothetical protein